MTSPYLQLSDAELTDLLRGGNSHAYSEIYNRYNKLLFIHAFKMLHDEEEAKDVVQELFTVLWNKRLQLSITGTLSSYLYTATRNRILDSIAHKKVQTQYLNSLQEFLMQGVFITDHHLRESDLAELIEKEIAALPPKMREVFELSRKKHLSHKEIAAELGISETTVKKQVNNAIKILRLKLNLMILMGYFTHL